MRSKHQDVLDLLRSLFKMDHMGEQGPRIVNGPAAGNKYGRALSLETNLET